MTFELSADNTLVNDLPGEAPSFRYPELASGLCECLLDTVMADALMSFLHNQGSQWMSTRE